jgi:tripartite-type tricarboxylate transporter receptor subunit TctC
VSAGGAGGANAGRRAASAKPDGYTLLAAQSATNGTALHVRKDVLYQNKDFEFLAQYSATELGLIVKADSPIKTLKDFIAHAKKNNVTFAYQGVGVGQHIVMELLKLKTGGLKITYVPVVSAFDLRLSVIGGHTDAAIVMGGAGGSGDEFAQVLNSGGRILAVASNKRLRDYPDIPTYAENGLDIIYQAWLGIAGPKGMPKEVSQKLKDVLYQVLQDPQVIKNLGNLGYKLVFRRSEEFTRYVEDFENMIKKVVEDANIPKS